MRDAIIKLPITIDKKCGKAASKNADPAKLAPNIEVFVSIGDPLSKIKTCDRITNC